MLVLVMVSLLTGAHAETDEMEMEQEVIATTEIDPIHKITPIVDINRSPAIVEDILENENYDEVDQYAEQNFDHNYQVDEVEKEEPLDEESIAAEENYQGDYSTTYEE